MSIHINQKLDVPLDSQQESTKTLQKSPNNCPELSESSFSSALRYAAIPFVFTHQLARAWSRLINPFSAYEVWSGEPHPQGHSPLKVRSLIHVASAASAFALYSMPRDYEPRFSSTPTPTNHVINKGEKSQTIDSLTVAEYCAQLVGHLPDEGLSKADFDRRFPSVDGFSVLAERFQIDLDKNIPAEFIHHVVISQHKHEMSMTTAQKLFPHLEESADFHLAQKSPITRTSKVSLLFLLQCEQNRNSYSTDMLYQESEQILVNALESNSITKDLRRHRVLGPLIDNVLDGVLQDMKKTPAELELQGAVELVKNGIIQRGKQHIIKNGAPPEMVEQYQQATTNIDPPEDYPQRTTIQIR